jgi:hypothetical protein
MIVCPASGRRGSKKKKEEIKKMAQLASQPFRRKKFI